MEIICILHCDSGSDIFIIKEIYFLILLQNVLGYAICCAVGTIFARIDCCCKNQNASERLRKKVGLIKGILIFVAVVAVTTTTTIMVRKRMQYTASEGKMDLVTTKEDDLSTVSTTLKTAMTEDNWTETYSPAFSTTSVTSEADPTSFFSQCPDYLTHLSNVLYSEQIGCILADIDDMTFQSFDEALKRCK